MPLPSLSLNPYAKRRASVPLYRRGPAARAYVKVAGLELPAGNRSHSCLKQRKKRRDHTVAL